MRFWLFLFLSLSGPALAQWDGWITDPVAAGVQGPVVLHFRRAVSLTDVPKALPVTVTADNRFILFVNGRRVASGPSTGTIAHWRTEAVDLAPYLHPGANVVAATVWDFVRQPAGAGPGGALPAASALPPQVAPIAQQSVALGFRLAGAGIATDQPGWRVKRDAGHMAVNGRAQVPRGRYYVASAPEVIDAAKADWDWTGPDETGGGWQDAVAAPEAAARHLVADRLPQQSFTQAPAGQVVRSDLEGASAFPDHPVSVPANSHVRILLRREAMISAYPELTVSGGEGATIKLTYTEALYDADNKKADRDLVADRRALGIFDTFLPDGARRRFMPLWWRTWRYAELDIQTGNAPLTLEGFRVYETGYPFKQVGHFTSSDPQLNRIWEVGWRTAQVDAHDLYGQRLLGTTAIYRRHAPADADLLCRDGRPAPGGTGDRRFRGIRYRRRAGAGRLSQPQRQCHRHLFTGLGGDAERLVHAAAGRCGDPAPSAAHAHHPQMVRPLAAARWPLGQEPAMEFHRLGPKQQ
jgi:hypothetical protein